MNIFEWMEKKEKLRAYLVAYGYSANPRLVAQMRDELAGGPDTNAPDPAASLAYMKAQFPLCSWPGDTPATVAARAKPMTQEEIFAGSLAPSVPGVPIPAPG